MNQEYRNSPAFSISRAAAGPLKTNPALEGESIELIVPLAIPPRPNTERNRGDQLEGEHRWEASLPGTTRLDALDRWFEIKGPVVCELSKVCITIMPKTMFIYEMISQSEPEIFKIHPTTLQADDSI
ncbi:hypothetical protein KM043_014876 [Ampulex compressa]|nr:hypothetical protein KM043_014876 [Ampulex compressa]